jgi:hypothetical protein
MTFGQYDTPSTTIQQRAGDTPARRRPVFVGREPELHQLYEAFETAASGDGSLIMLAGEPGIGKTALCEQLASFVGTRNGLALIGHCYQEGSAGVPYQPFVEAFEGFRIQRRHLCHCVVHDSHSREPRSTCSVVVAEEFAIADIAADHRQAAVTRLVHDGAL